MRYLRQFSEWKDRQSAVIAGKTAELKSQKEELAGEQASPGRHAVATKGGGIHPEGATCQTGCHSCRIEENGDALKTHLSKKQAEANQLRNRIAQLIAAEEEDSAGPRRSRSARPPRRKPAARRSDVLPAKLRRRRHVRPNSSRNPRGRPSRKRGEEEGRG